MNLADEYSIKVRRSNFCNGNRDNIDELIWLNEQYHSLPRSQQKYFNRNLKKNFGAYINKLDYADYRKLVESFNCALEKTKSYAKKPRWYHRFVMQKTYF